MIMFASNCIGWEPTHNGSTSLLLLKNHILSPHSTADLPPSGILTTELAGVVTITLLNAGTDPRSFLPCACTYRSFAGHTFISQNSFLRCVVVVVYTMATRQSSRRTKPPIKLKDFVADDFVAESTTPQQMSVAVKRELSKVESLIKDLTTTSFKAEQPTVNDRATKDFRNRDLQLELDLTRTKLGLL